MAKVPREVIRERERRAWELRQQGATHDRIALELGVDRTTVTKLLARLSQRYLATIQEEVGAVKGEQVAQLSYIYDEAMQAWSASKQASKVVGKRVKKVNAAKGGSDGEEVTTRVQDEDGDPRYLQTAMSALSDIRKILGADAPIKANVNANVTAEVSGGKQPVKVQHTYDVNSVAEVLAILAEAGAIPAPASDDLAASIAVQPP